MLYAAKITRLRRPAVRDPYSEETRPGDWADATGKMIRGAVIAPSQSFAVPDATRSAITSIVSVFVPAGADILPGDRVRDTAGVWEVEAFGLTWQNPFTGARPGTEYALKQVNG